MPVYNFLDGCKCEPKWKNHGRNENGWQEIGNIKTT
jgi:hypothetical protein